jgi:predicted nucleotidyltransferase
MAAPVNPADTARHLQRLAEARRLRAVDRAKRLHAVLPAAQHLLQEHYGAGRVILFGSLASGAYSERSDVDLAVDGLPAQRYFEALAELMDLFAGPVDLVRLEEAPESLRARIAAEGKPL